MGETELAKRAFLAEEHVSALEHDLYDAVVRLEKQLAEVVRERDEARRRLLATEVGLQEAERVMHRARESVTGGSMAANWIDDYFARYGARKEGGHG